MCVCGFLWFLVIVVVFCFVLALCGLCFFVVFCCFRLCFFGSCGGFRKPGAVDGVQQMHLINSINFQK